MAYSSKGRKPIERASKISHRQIINNPSVRDFINRCELPSAAPEEEISSYLTKVAPSVSSNISTVIAIDGGYTEAPVRESYPSASLTFFNHGPLLFQMDDLKELKKRRIVDPEALLKLKNISRHHLILPSKGIRLSSSSDLSSSIRSAIYEYFSQARPDEGELIRTLSWFLFQQWSPSSAPSEWIIENCPWSGCGGSKIKFTYGMTETQCSKCSQKVYLTDCFRFQERIDEEIGASGINAYVMTTLEHFELIHIIRQFIDNTPLKLSFESMGEILFIKDGPLAFFGLVAPLHKTMRQLTSYLLYNNNASNGATLKLIGLEKSGAFVEHADQVSRHMEDNTCIILCDDYIKKYIVPASSSSSSYGNNTYYGQKIIYKSQGSDIYVASIPAGKYYNAPKKSDIPHLDEILGTVKELRCHMYDNAIVPVALVNKLVSLADHPSQKILSNFAKKQVSR